MEQVLSVSKQRGPVWKRLRTVCALAVPIAGLAIAEPVRADVIRFYFDNMAAYFENTNGPPIVKVEPARAGFVQFSLAEYYAGIDFSISGPRQFPPDWEDLGVDDLQLSFGDIDVTLDDLSAAFPPQLVSWRFDVTIPDEKNPEDLKQPNVQPTLFRLELTAMNDVLLFGLGGPPFNDQAIPLTGTYGSDNPALCFLGPSGETTCTVSGILSGPHYVPEPPSLAVLSLGLFGLAAASRRWARG